MLIVRQSSRFVKSAACPVLPGTWSCRERLFGGYEDSNPFVVDPTGGSRTKTNRIKTAMSQILEPLTSHLGGDRS
jgi:hypothetical protein